MPPQLQPAHRGLGKIRLFLRAQLDDARPDVAAADINSQDAVVAGEDPAGDQLYGADQARMVGLVPDRLQFDLVAVGLEQDPGAPDGEFADPTAPQTAADHDPF